MDSSGYYFHVVIFTGKCVYDERLHSVYFQYCDDLEKVSMWILGGREFEKYML